MVAASRSPKQDHVGHFGVVRFAQILVIHNARMCPQELGVQPVEARQRPQRLLLHPGIPRRSRRPHQNKRIEKGIVDRPLQRMNLVQSRRSARVSLPPPRPGLSAISTVQPLTRSISSIGSESRRHIGQSLTARTKGRLLVAFDTASLHHFVARPPLPARNAFPIRRGLPNSPGYTALCK